ncbi:MAG: putative beta-lysine N-acetyltransferase [Polyangia bacterium]
MIAAGADPSRPSSDRGVELELEGVGFRARVFASPLNRRVRVIEYRGDDMIALARELEELARARGLDKIFAKLRSGDEPGWERIGFETEALIRGFFAGVDAVVVSRFLSEERRRPSSGEPERRLLESLLDGQRRETPAEPELPAGYGSSRGEPRDAEELAALYARTFESYPFPVDSPRYIAETMAAGVLYRLVRDPGGELVAAASAECVPSLANAEMTDFATRPAQRGWGLAGHLLRTLELDAAERDVRCAYTLARAGSAGMNSVFARAGYEYTGTLVRNCEIGGRLEDMHCWCRTLP